MNKHLISQKDSTLFNCSKKFLIFLTFYYQNYTKNAKKYYKHSISSMHWIFIFVVKFFKNDAKKLTTFLRALTKNISGSHILWSRSFKF